MSKRGTDHKWKMVKYKGDMAKYFRCKCGFEYCCSSLETGIFKSAISKIYPYCPCCGARKKRYEEEPSIILDILEKYK